MTTPKRDLLLITGIPGTGKTTFGETLARDHGFRHHNLEDQTTLNRWGADPKEFVREIVRQKADAVVTWGFVPDHEPSFQSVLDFKKSGFKVVWFDGNRPAALREFIKRGTVAEVCFYVQMYKTESTNVIERIKPVIINPGGYPLDSPDPNA
jgi:adenylate kinase family enzyme